LGGLKHFSQNIAHKVDWIVDVWMSVDKDKSLDKDFNWSD